MEKQQHSTIAKAEHENDSYWFSIFAKVLKSDRERSTDIRQMGQEGLVGGGGARMGTVTNRMKICVKREHEPQDMVHPQKKLIITGKYKSSQLNLLQA